MKPLLLDTHIWFRVLTQSQRLPRRTRKCIERAGAEVGIAAITLWEVHRLHASGRIRLRAETSSRWIADALAAWPVRVWPLDRVVAHRMTEISLATCDPADHMIAATALANDLLIVTEDAALHDAGWLPVWRP